MNHKKKTWKESLWRSACEFVAFFIYGTIFSIYNVEKKKKSYKNIYNIYELTEKVALHIDKLKKFK